jgi:hypothetical protein
VPHTVYHAEYRVANSTGGSRPSGAPSHKDCREGSHPTGPPPESHAETDTEHTKSQRNNEE